MIPLPLGRGVVFELHLGTRETVTTFPDRRYIAAQRPETAENAAEAADQGYAGEGAVWRSLAEHEALHTLAARVLWGGRESRVLRHECGAEPCRYALRLYEETVVLGLQRWLNTGEADPVLADHFDRLALYAAARQARLILSPHLAA